MCKEKEKMMQIFMRMPHYRLNWIGLCLSVVIGSRLTNGIEQWAVGLGLELLMLSVDY